MNGKILLVSVGPGAEQHMTYRAKAAIAEADVVIGYSTYIKLVRNLLDGKEVVKKGMTEEIDRCIEAYQHAQDGKIVALISSGDIGIYGMAGPTYEVLLQAGWTPDSDITVEIIPGSTALSSCASLVGAPLTHDFCSISLSDLLTPWPTIAKRLEAAAAADFVLALYNPKSGRRTQQIVQAQNILLRHRSPTTPVAIVKSAYRSRQRIQLVQLAQMADCDIGMLTTVIVGNCTTFVQAGLMVTPRGYTNKYTDLIGDTKQGEQAGRSLSMGLDGWGACLCRWLQQNAGATFEKAAEYFAVPLGEVLAAVAAGCPVDYHAKQLPADQLKAAVSAAKNWGKLRCVLRSAGAVGELLLHGEDFKWRGDWLNIENDHFHLHVRWDKVASAYFASRADKSYGLHFVDIHGCLVFRLLLTKTDGQFNAQHLQSFQENTHNLTNRE